MLRHGSVTTTERHYARWLDTANDRIAEAFDQAMPSTAWPEVASDKTREAEAK
jgi:hypothetical protein